MDALVDFLLNFYGPTPYFLVFGILIACGLGLPIPEDVTLFAAGLLAYYGVAKLWIIIAIAFVGVLSGDVIIFYLGAHYGRKLTKKWFFHRLLPDDRLAAVQKRFHKKEGTRILFAARFMPGLRAPVYFSAGILHVPFSRFILFDGLAAMVSVPLIIGAVYLFGDELDRVVRVIKEVEHSIIFVILAIVLAILGKWYLTHRRLNRS